MDDASIWIMKGEKMAVLSREEFLNQIHTRIGDDSSDESIKFLEDMTDTYNDLEEKINNNGEDWKHKYEVNDAMWKKRYQNRFFSGNGYSNNPDNNLEESPEDKALERASSITFDDLFGGKK